GWGAFQEIGYVDSFPPNSHCRDHVVEELSSATDKWFALLIFVRSWAFANEHDVGSWIAHAEDDLLASLFVQRTASAIAKIFTNQSQSFFWSQLFLGSCRSSRQLRFFSSNGQRCNRLRLCCCWCDTRRTFAAVKVVNSQLTIKAHTLFELLLELWTVCHQELLVSRNNLARPRLQFLHG